MLRQRFALEPRRLARRVPTRRDHDSAAANENRRSRGRFPFPSASTKNHKTGFGRNRRVLKPCAFVVSTDEFRLSSFLQSRGRKTLFFFLISEGIKFLNC